MKGRLFALLVCDRPCLAEGLKLALKDLSVDTYCVPTCEEVRRLIPETQPLVVFTDVMLPDGTWMDVLNMSGSTSTSPNVIVVSASKDLRLYLVTIENGAFDFVMPPFERQGLDFVVQSAAEDARRRRLARAQSLAA